MPLSFYACVFFGSVMAFLSIQNFKSKYAGDRSDWQYIFSRYLVTARLFVSSSFILLLAFALADNKDTKSDYWIAYTLLGFGVIALSAALAAKYSVTFDKVIWNWTWKRDSADNRRLMNMFLLLAFAFFFGFFVFYRPLSGIPG